MQHAVSIIFWCAGIHFFFFQAGGESAVTAPPPKAPPSEPLLPSPWQQQEAPVPWQQERRGGGGQWGQRSSRWDQSTFPTSHPDEPPPPPPAHDPHYDNREFDRGTCEASLMAITFVPLVQLHYFYDFLKA